LLCLHKIDKYFKMKPDSIGDPNFYLGAKVWQTKFLNGVFAWGMSSSKYIQAAVRNVKDYIAKTCPGLKLAKQAMGPLQLGIHQNLIWHLSSMIRTRHSTNRRLVERRAGTSRHHHWSLNSLITPCIATWRTFGSIAPSVCLSP
jgi:hypothetical protein